MAAWFNLGRAIEALSDDEAAAAAYLNAVRAGDDMGRLGLALADRRSGKLETARARLEEASRSSSETTRQLDNSRKR